MASLYELTGQFLAIYQLDIDDETKADTLDACLLYTSPSPRDS